MPVPCGQNILQFDNRAAQKPTMAAIAMIRAATIETPKGFYHE